MEPASGFSTFCRSCGGHIKLEQATRGSRGKPGGLIGLARGSQPAAREKPPAAALSAPAMRLKPAGNDGEDAQPVACAASLPSAPLYSAAATNRPREIICFDCQAVHRVSAIATSTICPGCSTCIDLRNFEVKDRNSQRIRTQGDVIVQKKGALLTASIHCGNITIYGTVSGSIHASGDVVLAADMKMPGEIRCRRFIVNRKCEVQCLQPVHAEQIEIDGNISGHLNATRCITLHRHACLTGSATAQMISVEPGAVLNGKVQVQPPGPQQISSTLHALTDGLAPMTLFNA